MKYYVADGPSHIPESISKIMLLHRQIGATEPGQTSIHKKYSSALIFAILTSGSAVKSKSSKFHRIYIRL